MYFIPAGLMKLALRFPNYTFLSIYTVAVARIIGHGGLFAALWFFHRFKKIYIVKTLTLVSTMFTWSTQTINLSSMLERSVPTVLDNVLLSYSG